MNYKKYSPQSNKDLYTLSIPRGRKLDLSNPAIMYILNVTEDSFSDGGRFSNNEQAIESAISANKLGANIIDIGAESTRPGSLPVDTQKQLDKILPIIEGIRKRSDLVISVDTSDSQVMEQAINYGADIINDVRALTKENSLKVISQTDAAVCFMHMQGEPATMQSNPTYKDIINEVGEFLFERAQAAVNMGINKDRIIIDPGFGFGKTLNNNLLILNQLHLLKKYDYPILIGVSRKSMIGDITGKPVNKRQTASSVAAIMAIERGANIIRVHDIDEAIDSLAIYNAINTNGK